MKKKGPVPSEGLLVLFLFKSVNTMTSAENQLYRFNYCLALMLVTIFFELVFTEHWRRSFWLSFLIICRWNLFRTICANSRKVGLGKFLSPYKDYIPVDLSRIPVNKGTNSRLRLTNTVICRKLSTRVSSSFLYICSLECNAGKVYY